MQGYSYWLPASVVSRMARDIKSDRAHKTSSQEAQELVWNTPIVSPSIILDVWIIALFIGIFSLIAKAGVIIHDVSVSLGMKRCKNFGSYNLLLKASNYLKACSSSFSQSTEHFVADLHPEPLPRCCRSAVTVTHALILVEADGKCRWQGRSLPEIWPCIWKHFMIISFHAKDAHFQVWWRFCW